MESYVVVRPGLNDQCTFGPFTRKEAEKFVENSRKAFEESGYIGDPGRVVNWSQNRASPCGPWIF